MNRALNLALGREMDDRFGADLGYRLRYESGVEDVSLKHSGSGSSGFGDVLAFARREVVEDGDLVTAFEQGIHQMRSDEARTPCDQNDHGRSL